MISTGFGARRFVCLGALGFELAAAAGVALAKGPDGPELQEKVETNQPPLVRPPGPISTEEAREALKKMKSATNGPGTWRRISVFDDTTFTHTNIDYQWQGPDGKRLERSEVIHQAHVNGSGAKTLPQKFLSVRNEEGLWKLHERVAILCPPPPPRASRRATAAGSGSTPGATNATPSGQAANSPKDEDDLIDENDPEIAADLVVIGERIKEGDRVVLRISKRMGPKAQRRVEVLIEQKIKEMKKEIPLLLRPLLTVSMIKKLLEKMLPVRTDLVLDEGTNTQILMLGYAKDGRFIMEERAWAPCPDLPPESYAVPKNLKLLRPKTSKEADQLDDDARKEDEKLRKR